MKSYKIFFALSISSVFLIIFSTLELSKDPLSIFVLKGSDVGVDAYAVNCFLSNQGPKLNPISLSPENQKLGGETFRSKDLKSLLDFSNHFGKWSSVVAIPEAEDGWPGFFGGGVRGFLQKELPEYFDNLQLLDRLFLSFMLKTPSPIPLLDSDKTPVAFEQKPVITPGTGPGPVSAPVTSIPQGVVRVEILNGCGITNAADWAARRLKGNGITIVGKDNADNFQYAKTIVRSAAGTPVALEEALDRLGLSRESVEEISNPPASADVVVIVGNDFRKLKERLRDRTHH